MIVCIEGNIGAGKTTAIKRLDELFSVYEEPVDKWTLLGKMYSDPKRFSFLFQMQVLLSYFDVVARAKKDRGLVIIERSPWSAANVFSKLCDWPDHHRVSYSDCYKAFDFNPDLIVYLDVSPEECLERIAKRGRPGESGITLEYLQRISELYEDSLACAPSVVRVSDGDELVSLVKKISV